MHIDGKSVTNPLDMAAALNDFFTSVFTHENLNSLPCSDEDISYPDMPPICICPQGVEQILSELKPHIASGPDMIPTIF